MLTKDRKTRLRLAFKWIVLSIIIYICFAISTTGGAGQAKPILLLPVIIAISTTQNELTAGIVGAISGLLVDFSFNKLVGINGVYFLLIGVITSFLFLHLMRKNFINVTVLTAIAAAIHGLLDFFLYYAMWNYNEIDVVFKKITLPSIIYTTLSAPIIFLIINWVLNKFAEPNGIVVENNKLK